MTCRVYIFHQRHRHSNKGPRLEHQLISFKISSVTKFKLSMLQLINPVPICQSPTDIAPHFLSKLFTSLRTHLPSKLCSFYINSSELTSLPKCLSWCIWLTKQWNVRHCKESDRTNALVNACNWRTSQCLTYILTSRVG